MKLDSHTFAQLVQHKFIAIRTSKSKPIWNDRPPIPEWILRLNRNSSRRVLVLRVVLFSFSLDDKIPHLK